MGKGKHQTPPTPDTKVNGPPTKGQHSELEDIVDHVGELRQVTATTQALVGFLWDQLQDLSVTIPLLRGFEIVRAKLCFIVLV